MNQMGFYVGNGIEGREKVRQKFSNLHAKYIKYCDARKNTGQGKLKVPKCYEEMEDILGDKHKVNPIINIDSLNVIKSTNNSECITIQEAETQSRCTSTSIIDDSATSNTLNGNLTP
ncbi:unnamed protein product [Psylliodes chrysocephalus]|uniref:Uncharacterized protein n=1 Tax=Psylliodes chrysocephalus TaxID=3402493 RepID=A0A9P0GN21_9CUCU|nr:unnamed protein product [Psylliodes chrysocephala]